ncbi:MAG TPA: hydrogenase small subunit [Candidatus Limnocylindrales bacterium]
MTTDDGGLYAALLRRGISRRAFLEFAAAMTAALALPAAYAPRVAAAVAASPRLPVVWLRGLDCGGGTEAFLRAARPTASELLLDLLSLEYHETLMTAAGEAATAARAGLASRFPGGYVAVLEGAVPTADGGAACTVGGRPFGDVAAEVTRDARFTIAVGSCAAYGGVAAASGSPTGARPVSGLVPGDRLVALPGCPVNTDNVVATIVHWLTFRQLPVTDGRRRPLFAYGGLVHNQCERRAHFEFGEFVQAWGDEAAQKGWCLYKMGCKGPETYANCPTVRFAEGASWPVQAGHGCVGCTMPGSWDAMLPAYRRLPGIVPLAPEVTIDQVGQVLVGGVGAMTVVHGAASVARARYRARRARSVAGPTAAATPRPEEPAPAVEPDPAEPAVEPTPAVEP